MSNAFPAQLDARLSLGETVFRAYLLLAGTLAASTAAAWLGARLPFAWQHPIILALAGFACLFLVIFLAAKDSPAAVPAVFGFAALEGLSLGPLLAIYAAMPQGTLVVGEATASTTAIFFTLSIYALVSRRDFSFLRSFLFVGLVLVVLASIAGIWLHIPAFHMAVAAASALIFSGYILVDTSRLVRRPGMSPVLMVVSLYLDILNLFLSLLRLFAWLNEPR